MKQILLRTSTFSMAVLASALIFRLLLVAGDKTKGPLEDLARAVTVSLASYEHQVLRGGSDDNRASKLRWLDRLHRNPALLRKPDTLFLGAYDDRSNQSYKSLVSLEDSLQVTFPLIQIYTAWGDGIEHRFPLLQAQTIHNLGSIPMISWEPWLDVFDPSRFPTGKADENPNAGGLRAIAGGRYDAYIDAWAKEAKNFGYPFFLRFGHEMNDPSRYPWGPQNNEPADYIAAWRHVVDRFQELGADNAVWVWSPHPAYANYGGFYPGEDYVDWVGLTTLNYGTAAPWSRWWTFDEICAKSYADLSEYGKPLMLTEFGCLPSGGDRAQWFREALEALPLQYPAVKAVVFFHAYEDNTVTFQFLDWSLTRDQETLEAVRESLAGWKKQPLLSTN